jgi:hypothetical protein
LQHSGDDAETKLAVVTDIRKARGGSGKSKHDIDVSGMTLHFRAEICGRGIEIMWVKVVKFKDANLGHLAQTMALGPDDTVEIAMHQQHVELNKWERLLHIPLKWKLERRIGKFRRDIAKSTVAVKGLQKILGSLEV